MTRCIDGGMGKNVSIYLSISIRAMSWKRKCYTISFITFSH